MKLLIKNKDEKEVVVSMGRELIAINIGDDAMQKNEKWNTNEINTFLIKISSMLDEESKIDVEYDQDSENIVYRHIVSLFETFAEEYNED